MTLDKKDDVIHEKIRTQLDEDAYVETLPFKVSEADRKELHNLFNEIALSLAKEDHSLLIMQIGQIERLLMPYWFSDESKANYMTYKLYDNFLLESDKAELSHQKQLLDQLKDADSPRVLFHMIGKFSSLYFESINHLLLTYREELESNQLMLVTSNAQGLMQKTGKLTSKPLYDYETFLRSRAFIISDADMNALYYTYEAIQKNSQGKTIKKLHDQLAPYWLKDEVINQFVPYESYKSTFFNYLTDDQTKTLDKLYEDIKSTQENKNVVDLITSMLAFNASLGDVLESQFATLYDAYDLNTIIKNKGE